MRLDKRTHGKHGWFNSGPKSFENLLADFEEIQKFEQSYPASSRSGYLYAIEYFLNCNQLNPTQALELDDEEIKNAIMKAVQKKQNEGANASARRIYYATKRFYELHSKEIHFNNTQRKAMAKWTPTKVAIQHIPSKLEIYRAVDAIPRRDPVQQTRSRALVLCLWQSGVRGSCLCSWKYGMFRDKLNVSEVPVIIKVVAYRPKGVNNVAQDTKLSGYKLSHYFTFLHKEAVLALRDYIEARKKYEGWNPKDSDIIFVTAGTVSRGRKLNTKHLNAIVKTAFEQISLDPDSIWTHLLRKSFRKTLYKGGVDQDPAEALMGHKLSGSKTAYFDFNDSEFLREQYSTANWERYPIKQLEDTVTELKENEKSKDKRIVELEKQLTYFKSPKFTKDILQNIEKMSVPLETSTKPVKVHQVKVKLDDGKRLAKLMREGYNPTYSDDEIWILEKEIEQ